MSKEQVYAIVRLDDLMAEVVVSEEMVAVVKVVRSHEQAVQETARLNDLNAEKGVRYLWRATRLYDA